MYSALIKRLRASCESCKLWDGYKCCLKGECSAQKSLQAADAIERLDAIAQTYAETVHEIEDKRKWIPVTERLPDYDEVVQITDGIEVGHGYLEGIDTTVGIALLWHSPFCDIDEEHITHWMPLPKAPESEGE